MVQSSPCQNQECLAPFKHKFKTLVAIVIIAAAAVVIVFL
jgi:hypothetical protein